LFKERCRAQAGLEGVSRCACDCLVVWPCSDVTLVCRLGVGSRLSSGSLLSSVVWEVRGSSDTELSFSRSSFCPPLPPWLLFAPAVIAQLCQWLDLLWRGRWRFDDGRSKTSTRRRDLRVGEREMGALDGAGGRGRRCDSLGSATRGGTGERGGEGGTGYRGEKGHMGENERGAGRRAGARVPAVARGCGRRGECLCLGWPGWGLGTRRARAGLGGGGSRQLPWPLYV